MAGYSQPPYPDEPNMQATRMPDRQYPAEQQIRQYPLQSRPQPRQHYSMPNVSPGQYQQPPYAAQYAPQVQPQQAVYYSHPTTPMNNGYPVGVPYPGQRPTRPSGYVRSSSHPTTHSHKHSGSHDHHKHHHGHHKKQYEETRPTVGDSVYALFDTLFSRKR